MRSILALAVCLFVLGVGVYAAPMLSPEARGVVVGVCLGVLASVPTTVILLYLLRRERADKAARAEPQTQLQPYAGRVAELPQRAIVVMRQNGREVM